MKNTKWLFLHQSLLVIVNGVLGILISRELGPEEFGEFSFYLSVVAVLSPLVLFGQNTSVPRRIHFEKEKRSVLLNSLFFSGILALIIGCSAFCVFDGGWETLLLLNLFFVTHGILSATLIALERAKAFAVVAIVIVLTAAGLKATVLLLEMPLSWFYALFPLEQSLMLLGLAFVVSRQIDDSSAMKLSVEEIRKSISEGWQLLLSAVATVINLRIDQIFLRFLSGFEAVGLYSIAVRLTEMSQMPAYLYSRGAFPGMLELYKNGSKDKWLYEMKLLYRKYLVVGILGSIALFLFSPTLIALLYTDDYAESANILRLYALSIPLSHIGAYNSLYLRIVGDYRNIMRRQLYKVVINIVLNVALVGWFGVYGATFATIAALLFTAILFDKNFGNRNLYEIRVDCYRNVLPPVKNLPQQ